LKKILIVDDSETMLRIAANTLKQAGFPEVATAGNALEAINFLENDPGVGLILSDWNMPRMSGLDFLKSVKANPATKEIPFVMVTSRNDKMDILSAIQSGAEDYIVKPFSAKRIKEKLDRFNR